ncbi:MAG: hypothetical protein WB509_20260 [Acetobacteraceae bacterium]
MQQEYRDAQEDNRDGGGHHALLGDLVRQEAMRRLISAAIGNQAAIGLQQRVHRGKHSRQVGAWRYARDNVIESTLHVESGCQRTPAHPQDAVPPVIRNRVTRAGREHIFRRQHNTHNAERVQSAV